MTFPLLDANVTRVYSSSYLYCSFLVTNAWRGMHPYIIQQESYVLDTLVNRSPSRFTIIVTRDVNLFRRHYYPRAFLGHQIVFVFSPFGCKHALQ